MTKHRIGVLALLAALLFCGVALAGSPGTAQYGPMDHDGPPPTAGGPQEPPALPFTGLQAGIVLMAGLAALAAGVVLRRGSVEDGLGPRLVVATAGGSGELGRPPGEELSTLFLPRGLERCEICGTTFDPMGFRISVGPGGRGFHSVECANRAKARGKAGQVASFRSRSP